MTNKILKEVRRKRKQERRNLVEREIRTQDVKDVAKLLNLSTDSVYKILRGER